MSIRRRFNCWMGWHRFNGVWDRTNTYTRCRDCDGWFRLHLTGVIPRAKDLENQARKEELAEGVKELIDFAKARASEAPPEWARAQALILHMLEGTVYEERAARILAEQNQGHPDHRGREWAP